MAFSAEKTHTCPVCARKWYLRSDGLLGKHYASEARRYDAAIEACPGSGGDPVEGEAPFLLDELPPTQPGARFIVTVLEGFETGSRGASRIPGLSINVLDRAINHRIVGSWCTEDFHGHAIARRKQLARGHAQRFADELNATLGHVIHPPQHIPTGTETPSWMT